MKTQFKISAACLVLLSQVVQAVQINPDGIGEVNLVPYYTVNNGLNTLVSITNTTADIKAVKINFKEGLNGYTALTYNVYLDAFDVWTFALTPTINSNDQKNVKHAHSDKSCAPFLAPTQDFLPFLIFDGPQSMQRAREGYIEVIEMGSISEESDLFQAAQHSGQGVPNDCNAFDDAFDGGIWSGDNGDPTEGMNPVSGGIMTEASLVNVQEGINHSIPVIALTDFFAANTIAHTEPYSENELSLDAAKPEAVINDSNQMYQVQFERGIDAVSALFMSDIISANYVLDAFVVGKTDIIYTQPTRQFYTSSFGSDNQAPYNSNSDDLSCDASQYGGTEFYVEVFDREAKGVSTSQVCPSWAPRPALCGSVFVLGAYLPSDRIEKPLITDSDNSNVFPNGGEGYTENGFVNTFFRDTRPLKGTLLDSGEEVSIYGIPVIGTTLFQFTNGGAVEGLLAQYGGATRAYSHAKIIVGETDTSKTTVSKSIQCAE